MEVLDEMVAEEKKLYEKGFKEGSKKYYEETDIEQIKTLAVQEGQNAQFSIEFFCSFCSNLLDFKHILETQMKAKKFSKLIKVVNEMTELFCSFDTKTEEIDSSVIISALYNKYKLCNMVLKIEPEMSLFKEKENDLF